MGDLSTLTFELRSLGANLLIVRKDILLVRKWSFYYSLTKPLPVHRGAG